MTENIKPFNLKPLFTIYVDDDGRHYAVRNFSPRFCLSAESAGEAAENAADAMAFHAKLKEASDDA